MAHDMNEGWIGKATAEFVATFGLVFFGAGSIVMNTFLGAEGYGLIGIAGAHAIVLAIVVSATMNISGGHVNPAVTFGAFLTKRIPATLAGIYVVAQLAGGIAGAAFVRALLPMGAVDAASIGATLTDTSVMTTLAAVSLELVLTFFLVFTVFGTGMSKHAPKVGGFAIGLVLFFDILVGGPLTGASMNPARTLGPVAVGAPLGMGPAGWLAVYFVGPLLGGALAAAVYDGIVEKGADA